VLGARAPGHRGGHELEQDRKLLLEVFGRYHTERRHETLAATTQRDRSPDLFCLESCTAARKGPADFRYRQPAGGWGLLVQPDRGHAPGRRLARRMCRPAHGANGRSSPHRLQGAQEDDPSRASMSLLDPGYRRGSAAGSIQLSLRPHTACGELYCRRIKLLSRACLGAGALHPAGRELSRGSWPSLPKRCSGGGRHRDRFGLFGNPVCCLLRAAAAGPTCAS
jgi:hypothetical protein